MYLPKMRKPILSRVFLLKKKNQKGKVIGLWMRRIKQTKKLQTYQQATQAITKQQESGE